LREVAKNIQIIIFIFYKMFQGVFYQFLTEQVWESIPNVSRIRKVPDLNGIVGIRELHIASVGNGDLSSWAKKNFKKNPPYFVWGITYEIWGTETQNSISKISKSKQVTNICTLLFFSVKCGTFMLGKK
jgi:hypothetical protein